MMDRRNFSRVIVGAFAGVGLTRKPGDLARGDSVDPNTIPSEPVESATDSIRQGTMSPFTLPPLPYAFAALEPHVDAQTMEIRHGKHHQAYVTNLNTAVAKATEARGKSLEDLLGTLPAIPESVRTDVRNNAGGHWNHSLFWQLMSGKGAGQPSGAIGRAITASFGDFAKFKAQFAEAAMTRFGSGWAWLVRDGNTLAITSTPNQDNPLMDGKRAQDVLLGVDVWEHAYYLKYQNRRADYLAAWWNVVNWTEVARRYSK